METKMQTSFIPKKPIVDSRPDGSGISLFLLLAIIVFIVSLALGGGVWLWQKSLISQIEKAKIDLVAAKDSYEEGTINPLIRFNDRLTEAQTLLNRHLAVSPIFILLEQNVLRNVRIKTMKFSYAGEGRTKLDLGGVAVDYDALLKQSDAFGAESLRQFISTPVISDFNPTPEGTVTFSFNALIDSDLISYRDTVADSVSAEVVTPDNGQATSTP